MFLICCVNEKKVKFILLFIIFFFWINVFFVVKYGCINLVFDLWGISKNKYE